MRGSESWTIACSKSSLKCLKIIKIYAKTYLFLDNNMMKVMATIQFLRRRSCGGFCPQTGRSTSRCYVAWTEEAPKGIYDHCGHFCIFFLFWTLFWDHFFALFYCFLRLSSLFPFKTLFSPHSCRFQEATWPLPGERRRVPTWKIVFCLCLRSKYHKGIESLNLRAVINVFERVI